MNKGEVIEFTARLTEARNIMDNANLREITRLQQALADSQEMLIQLRIRQSELVEYVQNVSSEWQLSINSMMKVLLDREQALTEDYDRRLVELRDTPGPKLAVSE